MSVGFRIAFANNTPYEVRLDATVGSPGDWADEHSCRPDKDIRNIVVAPFSTSSAFHLERQDYRATAPFTVTAVFANGTSEVFELDGCHATEMKNDREVPWQSGSSERTSVLQVTAEPLSGESWNRMFVYMTPHVSTADWMGRLSGDPSLMHITIPGSHDSGTYPGYGGSSPQCQTLDIRAQLDSGIRFLDLRLVVEGNDLIVYHSGVSQYLSFKDTVLPAIVAFLAAHDTECVVICVNHAKSGQASYNTLLHSILMAGVPANKLYDHDDPVDFPLKVKALKGCVILVRRDADMTYGIDMRQWSDNPRDQTFLAGKDLPVGTGTLVRLQDNYQWTDLAGAWDNKWHVVAESLLFARTEYPGYSNDADRTWFINFTSAGGIVVPWDFAVGAVGHLGINYRLARDLVQHYSRDGRIGTVMMDFPEQPGGGTLLTRLLLGTNTYG